MRLLTAYKKGKRQIGTKRRNRIGKAKRTIIPVLGFSYRSDRCRYCLDAFGYSDIKFDSDLCMFVFVEGMGIEFRQVW